MIREVADTDRADIARIVERFGVVTEREGLSRADADCVDRTVQQLMAHDDGVMFVAERAGTVVGYLAAVLYMHPLTGDRIASKLSWWVNPESRRCGVRLLAAVEAWATARGAMALHVAALDDHVGSFLARRGYRSLETVYQRSL